MRSWTGWLCAGLTVGALSAAVPTAEAQRPKPIRPAAAFALPSAGRCLSAAELTFRVRKVRRVRWTRATVKVNGRVCVRLNRSQLKRKVKLTRLPAGTIRLQITVRASDGRRAKIKRTYRRCAAPLPPEPEPQPQPAPPVATPTPTPAPTATATPAPSATPTPPRAPAGSYSVGGTGLSSRFHVSPGGTQVPDVAITIDLACTPGGSLRTTIPIGEIAIEADGSFSATPTENGVVANSPTYDDGLQHTCTSNDAAWVATRTGA